MSGLALLMVAVGLAADAFAASVAEGTAAGEDTVRHTLRVSLLFGLFQGVMPVLGWLAGNSLQGVVGTLDHWVAFGLLNAIGARMVAEALRRRQSGRPRPAAGVRLLGLALATSIDAFIIGVSIAMLRSGIITAALVIALVTACLCAVGVQAGRRMVGALGPGAEVAGGLILMALGAKTLWEHLS